jgi:hypothetical protein
MAETKPAANTFEIDVSKRDDLGAALIAYEIAIVAILDTLAKKQPTTAKAISIALEGMKQQVPETQFPKVRAKVNMYQKMIADMLSQNPQ